jgi:hypothetical protein
MAVISQAVGLFGSCCASMLLWEAVDALLKLLLRALSHVVPLLLARSCRRLPVC